MDMWNRYGDVVFNAGIRNNNDKLRTQRSVCKDIVEFMEISSLAFLVFVVYLMKIKTTRENLLLRELNEGKTPLRWLLVSVIKLLIWDTI